MANPARDIDRCMAARLRWAALVLGSAMMIVGLAYSLAISVSKKSGRAPTISSLFLLQLFQNLWTFLAVYPLGAVTVLVFIARACKFWSTSGARAHGSGLPLAECRLGGCAAERRQGGLNEGGGSGTELRPRGGIQSSSEATAVTSTGERAPPRRGDVQENVETRAVDIEECLPSTFGTAKC